jgi:hypothetical protein
LLKYSQLIDQKSDDAHHRRLDKGAMKMDELQIQIGLLLGLLPYRVERVHRAGGRRTLQVRALFWSLAVQRQRNGRRDWVVRVPAIERLRDAAWAAVMHLRDGPPPQD